MGPNAGGKLAPAGQRERNDSPTYIILGTLNGYQECHDVGNRERGLSVGQILGEISFKREVQDQKLSQPRPWRAPSQKLINLTTTRELISHDARLCLVKIVFNGLSLVSQ